MHSWDPAALECLAAIVEEGGFERAAQKLHITQSAVSQRLRALEAQVARCWWNARAPSSPRVPAACFSNTPSSCACCADLAHELQELAPQTGQSLAGEIVSIAINADSIATWAMTALDELVRGGLPLEVVVDDQDFTQELLRSGQVMGCVTTLSQAMRGCTVQPLGAMRYVAVAACDFARDRLPQGLTRKNFNQLPYLSFNRKDDMQAEFVRAAWVCAMCRCSTRFCCPVARPRYVPYAQAGAWACCPSCWHSLRWRAAIWSMSHPAMRWPLRCSGIAGIWSRACWRV